MKYISSFHSTSFRFIALLVLLSAFVIFIKNRKRKRTLYAITPDQIIFQYPDKKVYRIEFDKIDNITITKKRFSKKIGTIFILLKNPTFTPFVTYNPDNFERRNHPTLESLDDIEEVAALIRKQLH